MQLTEPSGDYLAPAFEHACVADAMRPGIFHCDPGTPLRAVARTMATNHVHSVVVGPSAGDGVWGIVSDLDLLRVATDADTLQASDAATRDVLFVGADQPLAQAAARMAQSRQTHAVVVDPRSREPIGMLSALDVAGNIAWALG